MNDRLRFGVFMAPFHKPGINPTLALEGDLELIQWLDRCGYDEAWIGEHHSAGTEIIASPEIFMGIAAERTGDPGSQSDRDEDEGKPEGKDGCENHDDDAQHLRVLLFLVEDWSEPGEAPIQAERDQCLAEANDRQRVCEHAVVLFGQVADDEDLDAEVEPKREYSTTKQKIGISDLLGGLRTLANDVFLHQALPIRDQTVELSRY